MHSCMLQAAKFVFSLTTLNCLAIFEDVFRKTTAASEAQASQASTDRRFVTSSRRLAHLDLSVETTRMHQGRLCGALPSDAPSAQDEAEDFRSRFDDMNRHRIVVGTVGHQKIGLKELTEHQDARLVFAADLGDDDIAHFQAGFRQRRRLDDDGIAFGDGELAHAIGQDLEHLLRR